MNTTESITENSNPSERLICVQIKSGPVSQITPGFECVWSNLVSVMCCAALRGRGVLFKNKSWPRCKDGAKIPSGFVLTHAGESIGLFGVTDWKAAVQTIRAELEAHNLAQYSKIAWEREDEGCWQHCFPEESTEDFAPIVHRFAEWAKASLPPDSHGPLSFL